MGGVSKAKKLEKDSEERIKKLVNQALILEAQLKAEKEFLERLRTPTT
jgi:hypothetical protein|tara:strand:- start:48 stop:191 length:144 start_codon:yes stop_codon:yes gene_type:complete